MKSFVIGDEMDRTAVVTEAFTELAPRYERTMDQELRQFWNLSYAQFIEDLARAAEIREGDVVLDVATGTAALPVHLARRAGTSSSIVGLDITEAMLRRGNTNLHAADACRAVQLVCASGTAMPFAGSSFDVVLCGLGTHHIDVPQLLFEMRRVLRPGGRLVLADVGASAFWRSVMGGLLLQGLLLRYRLSHRSARVRAEADAFPNVRTADEWRDLLRVSGFRDRRVIERPARHRWYPNALTIQAVAG